jgi:uncharacterized protein YjbI with pentapeptide repeats
MDTKIIGGKIAEARKNIGLSQAQLAEQLFISPQAVGKWERGESLPDIITCNRLAEIFGVDLNYFSGSSRITAAESPISTDPGEKREQLPEKPKNRPNRDMSRGNWVGADFSGLKNLSEKFSSSNMQKCLFIGSDMSGLLLKSNHIDSCDFSGSAMKGSRIQGSHVTNNAFGNCVLTDAELSGSHIKGCDFSNADFGGATIRGCSFQKNIIAGAALNRTAFIGSDISDIAFEGTVEECAFENCSFSKVTFRNSTLIDTFFKGGNLKKIRFVDCRADRMTYEFLKNGKADLSGITLITNEA